MTIKIIKGRQPKNWMEIDGYEPIRVTALNIVVRGKGLHIGIFRDDETHNMWIEYSPFGAPWCKIIWRHPRNCKTW